MSDGAAEERRLVVVMFTDMVDYAARVQRDEALGLQALEEHNRLLRSVFAAHGGQEIKSTGDGFMLAFSSALAAVRCAIEVQKRIVEHNATAPPECRFQVRIGLHLGDVVYRAADMVGDGVNIAARIEPLADAGGICLSGPVYDQVHNKIDAPLVRLGRPELKNIQEPIDVYRVVLPWQQASPSHRVPRPVALPRRTARWWTLGLAAVALAALVYVVTRRAPRTAGPTVPSVPAGQTARDPRPSIAVLPFANLSAQKDDAYLSAGVTDELSNALARVSGLRVVSVPSLPADAQDARGLGQRLNVASVLKGSVRKAGPQLRIMVQLVTIADGNIVWSDIYNGEFRKILAIQSDVAERVTGTLKVRLLAKEAKRLRERPTASVEAYQAYLKGRHSWDSGMPDTMQKGIALFERAIRLDPEFAEAYSGLADNYTAQADFTLPPRRALEAARKAARKALDLDPTLAEAQTSLAMIRYAFDYDWIGAEQELRKAISLNPDYALAHHQYGWLLVFLGRFEEGLAELQRAERLAPLSVTFTLDVNVPYTLTRRYDLAIAQCEKALDLDPNHLLPQFVLGWIHDVKGDYATAITHLEKARTLAPGPPIIGWLGHACARAGRTAEARRLLAELKTQSRHGWVTPSLIAFVQLGLGDNGSAMDSLEEAYQARSPWLTWLKVEPAFDPLRSDPRFAALLRKVGLAE